MLNPKFDIKKFSEDFDSKEIKEKVDNDYRSGLRLGVNATPTFFLNGQKLQNPRSYEEFKELIQVKTLNIGWNEWRHFWTLWNHEYE